ncbi:MAG: c-type cytochrome [Thermodesulfovibrionales bacterium]
MVSSDHLIPEEEGEIEALVKTRGKRGRITKTVHVFSNDPERPSVTLTLVMRVIDPYHTQKFKPEEIFNKPCSECHVDRGKGKTGAALFNADCLICHRTGKSGKSYSKLKSMTEDALRSAINSGVPNTMMPGFSWKEDGPLNREEIGSIIRYIKRQ